MEVRKMSPDEAGWAAELMDRRREIYARYSPMFWRPAQGVKGKHADFLGRQIGSASNVALRTDHAFIIAQQRKAQGFADDFAVDQDGSWDGDGATLLLAASELLADTGVNTVMVVTAHADEARASMLCNLSLRLTEQWWVRELPTDRQPIELGHVEGSCFRGILESAPPVYDPGGPVLQTE